MDNFFQQNFENVHQKRPLVHCMTNYVTVNDCTNILLAVKASPIMTDAPEELAELYRMVNAVCINIGTPNNSTLNTMGQAVTLANERGIPVVLDPVGAGATTMRTEICKKLLSEGHIALVRGNISELKALAGISQNTRGTDASGDETVSDDNFEETVAMARELVRRWQCLVGISGPTDLIVSLDKYCLIRNGHPIMTSISGTGCMLSAVCAAFLGANPKTPFEAVATAFAVMGYCGETAEAITASKSTIDRITKWLRKPYLAAPTGGPMTWRTLFMDTVAGLKPQILQAGVRYEIR